MPKAAKKHTTTRERPRPTKRKIDPIFAALERHKALDRIFNDVCGARDEGRAKRCDVDRASDAAERAAWKMARTRPTTVAGASALLTYIATGPITGLFELGETNWHETAFRTVATSLAKIARQSQRAA
jgi:hypothetical protein